MRVLASLCSLESILRKLASAFRAAHPERERQFADVSYAELLADPLAVVARL